MFAKGFDKYVGDGDYIVCFAEGFKVRAVIRRDEFMGEPWKEHDGHGPVSEWTTRDKRPGERILVADDRLYSKMRRYYDVERAVTIAKRDGWDAPPYGEGTPGERAARAVERNFQALRAWCHDEWYWGSMHLEVSFRAVELDDCAASLGGIEVNWPGWGEGDNSHLLDIANELLPEAIERAKAVLETLQVRGEAAGVAADEDAE